MPQTADAPESRSAGDGGTTAPAPITSRFLFVDVAAQRAKQLRRGALARLDRQSTHAPHKLERIAMEEVRSGLIEYELPTRPEPPKA
jgi:DNA-directed RNA polymerase omega subunit